MIINIKTLLLIYIKYILGILLLLIFLQCEQDSCVPLPTIDISSQALAGESPSYVAFVESDGNIIEVKVNIGGDATVWEATIPVDRNRRYIYGERGIGDSFYTIEISKNFIGETRIFMVLFEVTGGRSKTKKRVTLTLIQDPRYYDDI